MGMFGYNPAYGLTDDYRLRVLHYADAFGVRRAAERYRVGQSTIYKWNAALRRNDANFNAWVAWAMEGHNG